MLLSWYIASLLSACAFNKVCKSSEKSSERIKKKATSDGDVTVDDGNVLNAHM